MINSRNQWRDTAPPKIDFKIDLKSTVIRYNVFKKSTKLGHPAHEQTSKHWIGFVGEFDRR